MSLAGAICPAGTLPSTTATHRRFPVKPLGKQPVRNVSFCVPFVAFGILRYLYLVDARNEGGDPARLLIRDMPLLLTVLLWIAADVILLYFL